MKTLIATLLLTLAPASAFAHSGGDSYELRGNKLLLNGFPASALSAKLDEKSGESYSCGKGTCEFTLGKISFSNSMPGKPGESQRLHIYGEGVEQIYNELNVNPDYGIIDGSMKEAKKIWYGYGEDPVTTCTRTSTPGQSEAHYICTFVLRTHN